MWIGTQIKWTNLYDWDQMIKFNESLSNTINGLNMSM